MSDMQPLESVMAELREMIIAMGWRQRRDLHAFLHQCSWPELQVVLTTDPETGEVALLLHGPRRASSLQPGSEP